MGDNIIFTLPLILIIQKYLFTHIIQFKTFLTHLRFKSTFLFLVIIYSDESCCIIRFVRY